MKKVILTLSLTASFLFVVGQNIWIADNRPTRPAGDHVFSSLQVALDTASPGDIIHVIPSQSFYGSPTISTDSLTVFGIGFNPQKDQPNKAWVENLTIASNVFGTRISGLNVNDDLIIGTTSGSNGNMFIENGDVNRIAGDGNTVISNIVIRNCIIGNRESTSTEANPPVDLNTTSTTINAVITNNIISGSNYCCSQLPSISVNDAIIKNNLFIGAASTNDYAFYNVTTSTISNNIFIGRIPRSSGSMSNTTYSNNISFGATNNTFPTTNGNVSDTTYQNTDPVLVNVPVALRWNFSRNPVPDVGSPAIANGNDGGDIGVTGGTIPFSITGTPLPIINVLRVPEIIKQGDNLNATIEATGN